MDLLAAAAVFVFIFLICLMLFGKRANPEEEAKERLERMTHAQEDEAGLEITRKPRAQESRWAAPITSLQLMRRLEENMWQAGLYARVSDIVLVMLLLFAGGMAFGQFLFDSMLFALAVGVALAALPIVYIRFRRARRIKAFNQQLPFALDLIKSSLEAGHTLQRALQVVVSEFADPLGHEFRTVIEQSRIGLPLTKALEEMLKRVPEDDLRLLVVAVKVQNDVGSSLASIIGRLSEIVRTRQRLRLQIRALTSQARLGGLVVGLLPVIVLTAFSFIQPGYTAMLFHDPTGIEILKIAIGLDVAALLVIRRLLRVNY